MSAIGFKAVHGGRISGVQRVTADVLAAMEEMNDVAPAHNPPYITAMRLLTEKLPEIPLVAAFETGFHATIPDRHRYYAVPYEWADEVARASAGASTAPAIATSRTRTAELLGRDDLRIISCHLGGSSSLCAIRGRQSVATSMGMSPQTGLPHNNRVGDFDPFALPVIMQATGKSLDEVLDDLADAERPAGPQRRQRRHPRPGSKRPPRATRGPSLALDVFATDIRRHLGGLLVELGGADAIVFTGGIGENGASIRAGGLCADWRSWASCSIRQPTPRPRAKRKISAPHSRTQIWIVPTNEELIVARQTKQLLQQKD